MAAERRAAGATGTGGRRRRRARCRAWTRLFLVCGITLLFTLGVPQAVRGLSRPAAEPEPVLVTVQPGDTLWDIARRHARGRDVRRAVWEIQQANGLTGSTLQPGMVLVIPTAAAS